MPFDSLTTGVSVFSPPWGKVLVMRIMTGILTLVRALPSASLHLDTLSRGSGGQKLGEARKIFDVLSIMANFFFFTYSFLAKFYKFPPSLFHKDRLRLMWQQDESSGIHKVVCITPAAAGIRFVCVVSAVKRLKALCVILMPPPLRCLLKIQEPLRAGCLVSPKTTYFMGFLTLLFLPTSTEGLPK